MEKRLLLTNLKNKKWIIILTPIIAGVITWFLMGSLQKKYKSVAQLSVASHTGDLRETPQENEMDVLNHVEAMKTEFMGLMVSYRLLMHDLEGSPFRKNNFTVLPTERESAITKLKHKLDSFDILSPYSNSEYRLMDAIDRKEYHVVANGDLKVKRIARTNFISVEFTSESPALSAYVVNTLCAEYIRYIKYSNRYPFDSLKVLGKLVDKKKNEWKKSTDLLASYRSEQASNAGKSALREKYENQFEEEEEKLTLSTTALREVSEKIAAQRALLADSQNNGFRNSPKVAQLQGKITELSRIYSNQGSKDKELSSTINALRKELQKELSRLEQTNNAGKREQLDQLLKEKSKIEANHAVITSNLNLIKDRLKNVGQINNRWPAESIYTLEREYDKSLKEYIRVRDSYEKAKTRIQTLRPSPELKVVAMGRPNFQAEPLNEPLIILIVMFGCAIIAVITILAHSYFHRPRPPIDPYLVILR